MSSLWTPGGERPIRREPSGSGGGPAGGGPGGPGAGGPGASGAGGPVPGPGGPGGPGASGGPGGSEYAELAEPSEEELRQQLAEMQQQLARTPAEVVVANHAYGLFELAALHLSLQPPQLEQARTAIDAFGYLVEGMGPRLGPAAEELQAGLAQLRMAFVQLSAAVQAGAERGGAGPSEPAG